MSPHSFPAAIEGDQNGARMEVPVAAEFCEPMIAFWEAMFGVSYAGIRPIMSGSERAVQRDIFWSIWSEDKPQATCHLTIDRRRPILGGLGEVATSEVSRGRGLAGDLCRKARSMFLAQGGKALFLGTMNPVAERVYQRLGWQSIFGSHTMVLLADHASPVEFFRDYFGRAGDPDEENPIDIMVINAGQRIAIIPLILHPHSEFLLDANLDLYSTHYIKQKSCMGLFGKYSNDLSHNRGIGFVAHETTGKTVGLATVKLDVAKGAQIDGFAHPHFSGAWDQLIQACVMWCEVQHRRCRVEVARRDAEKLARFEKLGFRITPLHFAKYDSGRDATAPKHDRINLVME